MTNEILTYYEKQIVLYTKRQLNSKTFMDDLRIIVSEQYALSVEHTMTYTIYHSILNLYFKLIESNHITESVFNFLEGLFSYDLPKVGREEILYKMLCRFQNVKVAGLNLGEYDFDVRKELTNT